MFDNHALAPAFLGYHLDRLANLLVSQGEVAFREAGISIPVRCSSLVLYLQENPGATAADIAKALDHPHQLITQRIALLSKLSLVTRKSDPRDGRRKALVLTRKGRAQASELVAILETASVAIQALMRELGADLGDLSVTAIEALQRKPLTQRFDEATTPN